MVKNGNKKRILIIDDDENAARMLNLFLVERGYEVVVVTDPLQAEVSIDVHNPHLIFLDYRMSPFTGKDILEKLKIRGVETPVVMISAYRRPHGDMEMKTLGAAAYLGKPFDFEEIAGLLPGLLD